MHVLNGSVHSVDDAASSAWKAGTDAEWLATIYAFTGRDYLPGTHGIAHDMYLPVYLMHVKGIGTFNIISGLEMYEII